MGKKSSLRLHFNRFGVQLPLLFFIAGFAVIWVFCGVIYFTVSDILLKETIGHTEGMMQMSSANITTYLDRLRSESALFAGDQLLRSYLSLGGEAGDQRALLEQRIDAMLANNSYIKSIVAVSKDGRILSSEKGLDMSVSEDMMKEKWYIDAIHENMPVLTGARMQSFSRDKDNWVISVSTEVTSDNGENAGVLLVDMKYSVIEELLKNLDLGGSGYVFLMNKEHEVVYHRDTAYFMEPEKKALLEKLLAQGNHYSSSGNILTSQAEIKNAGWTMVGVVFLDNLKVLKQQLLETVIFTGGLLLFLMFVIGTVFTRRLGRPIRRLEQNMLQIEKLDEIQPEPHGFYEMELFAANYNQMIRRIRRLMEELSGKEENMRCLELQALINQINPHFLYNTLDTIVWMAEFNDSKKVIALTKSLASFFRVSLSNGREIITVGEELEHVRQYLFIQKERYEEKLEYEIEADDQVLGYPIPKIILQPLVENSIYHGIKPLKGPGRVRITAGMKGERICLAVTDNGVGFLTTSLSEKTRGMHSGVGLDNVRERIGLYYGENGSFDIQSMPEGGCTVTVEIAKRLMLKGSL